MSDLKKLGPYEIQEQLGVGGMAVVYKAYHPSMKRFVAIKVLARHMATDPNFLARFHHEAQVIARLEHRHILPVHDIGEDHGIPYLVMRYTDAGTMSDLLARGPLPLERAVDLVAQVGEALAYAHRQGVIHRDIKPANVLLSREGDALLSDFGIAKIVEGGLNLTADGALLGTPFYMAPEQVRGQPADERSDLYALGVVLYESLTGRRPYVAETPMAVALMHVHEPLPPPRQLNRHIPDFLELILLRALAKEPHDRFQRVEELVAALREAQLQLRGGATTGEQRAIRGPEPETMVDGAPFATGSQPAASSGSWPGPSTGPTSIAAPAVDAGRGLGPAATGGTPSGKRRLPLGPLLGGGLLVLALVALVLLRPWEGTGPRLTPQPTQQAFTFPAGPTVTPRQNLRVFTSTRNVNDLLVLGDTIWAATWGGLVRVSPDGTMRTFTVADGFNQTVATALLRAPDDTIWVGHGNGVSRVKLVADGIGEVRFFSRDEGIFGEVSDLMLDTDGSIVAVSSWGSSIVRFEGEKWVPMNLPLDAKELEGLRLNAISVLRDVDGALWVGLDEMGLLRWKDNAWHHFSESEGLGNARINTIFQDRQGTLWVAAGDKGLLKFLPAEGRFQRVSVVDDEVAVTRVDQRPSGELVVTTEQFLAQSGDGGATWVENSLRDLQAWGYGHAVEDGAGRLWLATNNGIARYESSAWTLLQQEGEPTSFRFQELAPAPGGLAAVPLYGGPVTLVDTAAATMNTIPEPEAQVQVFSALVADEERWLGTPQGLLRLRNDTSRFFKADDGLPDNSVTHLASTAETIWIGTEGGLIPYDRKADALGQPIEELQGARIRSLHVTASGDLWVGTSRRYDDNGQPQGSTLLGHFDGTTWEFWRNGEDPIGPEGDSVDAIGSNSAGVILVSVSNYGLATMEGGTWRVWSQDDGAPPAPIFAFATQGENVWMGGQMVWMLYRWNSDGWRRVEVEGLSAEVYALRFADDGALWAATGDGLMRLEVK